MPRSVLIIDRQFELVQSIADALEGTEYDTRTAWRLEQVFSALAEKTPAIVISHSTVPDASHTEVDLMPIVGPLSSGLVVISSRPFSSIPALPAHAIRVAKPFGRDALLEAMRESVTRR